MSNNPEKLRVGVIGGGIGRHHLHGYQMLAEEVEIVALCDLDKARLKEVGDLYSVPFRYTDYNELFASGEIEAVSVCLPNSLHAPISTAALEAGLHVLCEKPLAENARAAALVAAAAARAPGKFMICFNRRYRPDTRWMKAAVSSGALGRIYQVRAGWVRETGIPGWGGWFTNKELAGGGPLIDLGVHMLDIAMWLLDYPQPLTVSGSVQANFGPRQAKTWRPGSGAPAPFSVEDSAVAFLRLVGEVSLTMEASWASHGRPGMDDFYVTLLGTEGTVELYVANYAAENTLTFYTEMNQTPVVIRPHLKLGQPDHDYAVAEFVKCIQTDAFPEATADQGLTLMNIIDAVYQSAEAGREVSL